MRRELESCASCDLRSGVALPKQECVCYHWSLGSDSNPALALRIIKTRRSLETMAYGSANASYGQTASLSASRRSIWIKLRDSWMITLTSLATLPPILAHWNYLQCGEKPTIVCFIWSSFFAPPHRGLSFGTWIYSLGWAEAAWLARTDGLNPSAFTFNGKWIRF